MLILEILVVGMGYGLGVENNPLQDTFRCLTWE